MGDKRFLVGKSEEEEALGRRRLRKENNIKVNTKETVMEGAVWICHVLE